MAQSRPEPEQWLNHKPTDVMLAQYCFEHCNIALWQHVHIRESQICSPCDEALTCAITKTSALCPCSHLRLPPVATSPHTGRQERVHCLLLPLLSMQCASISSTSTSSGTGRSLQALLSRSLWSGRRVMLAAPSSSVACCAFGSPPWWCSMFSFL